MRGKGRDRQTKKETDRRERERETQREDKLGELVLPTYHVVARTGLRFNAGKCLVTQSHLTSPKEW